MALAIRRFFFSYPERHHNAKQTNPDIATVPRPHRSGDVRHCHCSAVPIAGACIRNTGGASWPVPGLVPGNAHAAPDAAALHAQITPPFTVSSPVPAIPAQAGVAGFLCRRRAHAGMRRNAFDTSADHTEKSVLRVRADTYTPQDRHLPHSFE
jgi:hypothetical protein